MKVFISIKNVNTDPRLLNSSVCAEGPDVQLPLSVSERAAWEFKGPWQSEALASSIIQHYFLSFSPSVFHSSNPLANWNVLLTHRQGKKQEMPEKGYSFLKINPFTDITAASLISPKTLRCLLLYGILHGALKFVSVNHTAGGILHQSLLLTLSLIHSPPQPLCVCDESYVSIRLCIEI